MACMVKKGKYQVYLIGGSPIVFCSFIKTRRSQKLGCKEPADIVYERFALQDWNPQDKVAAKQADKIKEEVAEMLQLSGAC